MLDEGSQTDAVLRGERRSLRGSSEDGIQPGFVEGDAFAELRDLKLVIEKERH